MLAGDITQGTPIAEGPFAGTVFATNFKQDPDGTSSNDVAGPITITEQGTGQELRLRIDGRSVASPSGDFVARGTYQIIGGSGRFRGATGGGTYRFAGQGGDPSATIETTRFSGTINYA